jgi:hypothetical protein
MCRVGSGGGDADAEVDDGRVWSSEAATEGRDTLGGGEPLTIWSRPVEVDMGREVEVVVVVLRERGRM